MDSEREFMYSQLHDKQIFIVYGCNVIRRELRETPKKIRSAGKNLRIDLLNTYDGLVRETYDITPEIQKLADQYYGLYREFGGSLALDDIKTDFLIVACASLHNLDIVVSDDKRTLLIENALKAYTHVNSIRELKNPTFIGYDILKKEIKRST